MSTKINVRSPFYLNLTEPVQTLGLFTCSTAGLSNFSVNSSGLITNPLLLKGNIIGQTETQFSANTSGSPISRSVTYTISIPAGYTNTNESTIDCVQTFDQPTQTPQEDPASNDNCPTFSGTIPDSTGSSATVTLSTYFTSGADADISSYEILHTPVGTSIQTVLSGTAPNQTLTISSSTDCDTVDLVVRAFNGSDSCTAISNTFSHSTGNCVAYDCTDANVTGGSIEQDGTVHKGTWILGTLNAVIYNGTDITTSLNVGANNTGSAVNKTITYRFNIPNGYSNTGTFDCDVVYSQPAAIVVPTFSCSDIQPSGGFISESGNIAPPTLGSGTLVSWTPQQFAQVSVNTPRSIYLTVTPPASGYTNSGGADITNCEYILTQPATFLDCGNTSFYFANVGYDRPEDFCNNGITTSYGSILQVLSNVSSFEDLKTTVGNTFCYRLSGFNGGNKYYAFSETPVAVSNQSNFYLLKIDDYGTVQEVVLWNCSGGGDGSGGRVA